MYVSFMDIAIHNEEKHPESFTNDLPLLDDQFM